VTAFVCLSGPSDFSRVLVQAVQEETAQREGQTPVPFKMVTPKDLLREGGGVQRVNWRPSMHKGQLKRKSRISNRNIEQSRTVPIENTAAVSGEEDGGRMTGVGQGSSCKEKQTLLTKYKCLHRCLSFLSTFRQRQDSGP